VRPKERQGSQERRKERENKVIKERCTHSEILLCILCLLSLGRRLFDITLWRFLGRTFVGGPPNGAKVVCDDRTGRRGVGATSNNPKIVCGLTGL